MIFNINCGTATAGPWALGGTTNLTSQPFGVHSGFWGLLFYYNPAIGTGTATETVNIAHAGTYAFSFWANLPFGSPQTLTATVGGKTVFNAPIANNTFQQFTTTTVLSAGATTVQFVGNLTSNWYTYIDDVSLTLLQLSALAPQLPANASINQRNVAGAVDTFTNNGGTLPSGFQNLSNLSPQQLQGALDQLSGETNAAGQQAGMRLMNSFLSLVVNPFATGRGNDGVGPAMGFAPERTADFPPEIAMAYASVLKAPPKAVYNQPWSIWASGYGGHANIGGDATNSGSHDTSTTQYGYATGLDYRLNPNTTVGFALAGGATNWGVGGGLGSGNSDVFQSAVYGSTRWGAAYLSGALAYGAYWTTTDRTVTVAGTDHLTAGFTAHDVGGRIESGYRFTTPLVGVTPYGGFQVQSFYTPGSSESATSGSAQFALTTAAQTTTDKRGELGAWFDNSFLMSNFSTMTLFARAAYAHDWGNAGTVTEQFLSLPSPAFVINGAAPPPDKALVTAGAQLKLNNSWTLVGKFDGEFADRLHSYAGTGTVRYRW
jgi:uncharacterized protein with beta-barrel porin domain